MPLKCCCGCDIVYDAFTTDSLSTTYDVDSGTWSVSSGKLRTSSANALLLAKSSVPASHSTEAFYTVSSPSSYESVRFVVSAIDSDNYLWAQVQIVPSPPRWNLQIGKRESGSDTTIDELDGVAGASGWVRVCYSDSGDLTAVYTSGGELDTQKKIVSADVTWSGGTKSGVAVLGNSSPGEVTFDVLVIGKKSSNCYECHCNKCETGTWPGEVEIEFSGVADGACFDAATLNSTTYYLTTVTQGTGLAPKDACGYTRDTPIIGAGWTDYLNEVSTGVYRARVELRVETGTGDQIYEFASSPLSLPIDCSATRVLPFLNYIDHSSESSCYDMSSATVTMTPVR